MEQTHSIKQLILDIDAKRIALPEFQRDFVWEIPKTHDLFDSLVKDIFIGAIIYGVPSFEIAVRDVDNRPRPKQGKRRVDLPVRIVRKEEIDLLHRINKDNFRLVLDGQQRTTSIYRAIKGIDDVYFLAKNDEELTEDVNFESPQTTLEQILYEFDNSDDEDRIAVRLSDVWEMDLKDMDEEEIKEHYF